MKDHSTSDEGQPDPIDQGVKSIEEKLVERLSFHEMGEEDLKMMYQAYRLKMLPDKWDPVEGMDALAYIDNLLTFIEDNFQYAWAVRDDEKTVGIFFGLGWGANSALIGDTIWNAKASDRNKYEATALALNELRKSIVIILRAEFKHKKLFERLMNQKVIRRVGTLYDLDGPDSKQMEYQTRRIWSVK